MSNETFSKAYKDGSITVLPDGSVELKARSAPSAIRILGEYLYDDSVGQVTLRRTPDRNLRIDLSVKQLKPRKRKTI